MSEKWLIAPPLAFALVFISYLVIYCVIILLTRIAGLRSFSKMSAPDFAMTVAVGSLFGSSISSGSPPLSLAIFAFALLFAGQWLIAYLRRVDKRASRLLDNAPVLLMEGQHFMHANMNKTQVTEADIRAKLREANVISLDQILAVVFESTGDISVLHSQNADKKLHDDLLIGVQREMS